MLISLLLGGCREQSGLPVEYVLPDGYRGEVEIVQDEHGAPLPIERGVAVCYIPTDGVLEIDTLNAFRRWHRETARYSSGQMIPLKETSDTTIAPSKVVLYNLGRSATTIRFFVGTRSEMLENVRNPRAPNAVVEFLSGGALEYRAVSNNIPR